MQPEVILSLDAEQVFNMIEWSYLIAALEKFGFGPVFCKWITVLAPMAAVQTNGFMSEYFMLYRVCLSPFLFDITIELLAVAIRADNRI